MKMMDSYSTTKHNIIDNYKNKSYSSYIPISVDIDDEFITRLCDEYEITILKREKNLYENSKIIFYKNNNPNRIMTTNIAEFVNNPNQTFSKSHSKLATTGKTPEQIKESYEKTKLERSLKHRAEYENKLRESMFAEGCILKSKCDNSRCAVHYEFEGMDYKVMPTKWFAGVRPHKSKCIRYTHEHIAQLFEKEGCKLISKYVNQKSRLEYEYKGKVFNVIWNDWKFYNCRPHLGVKKTYFTDDYPVFD